MVPGLVRRILPLFSLFLLEAGWDCRGKERRVQGRSSSAIVACSRLVGIGLYGKEWRCKFLDRNRILIALAVSLREFLVWGSLPWHLRKT